MARDRRRRNATGSVHHDIAGFTPLTEALDRALGSRQGAEALTRQLNQLYEALIAQLVVEETDGAFAFRMH